MEAHKSLMPEAGKGVNNAQAPQRVIPAMALLGILAQMCKLEP